MMMVKIVEAHRYVVNDTAPFDPFWRMVKKEATIVAMVTMGERVKNIVYCILFYRPTFFDSISYTFIRVFKKNYTVWMLIVIRSGTKRLFLKCPDLSRFHTDPAARILRIDG